MPSPVYLFEARQSTGNGTGVNLDFYAAKGAELKAWGTWGGTTLTVEELMPDGTTWVAVSGLSFTSNVNGYGPLRFKYNTKVRGVLTGGSGMNLNVLIQDVG